MRIGILATRLSGTDGVSLETAKWVEVLKRLGHEVFFAAGELSGVFASGCLIPKMHFQHETILEIQSKLFNQQERTQLNSTIVMVEKVAQELSEGIQEFIHANRIEYLIVENALAIPMNVPLGIAIMEQVRKSGLPGLAHHHDFFWERERFNNCIIPEMLEDYFPGDAPGLTHVTINSLARDSLLKRKSLDSVIVPNVFDFAVPPPKLDQFGRQLRNQIGFSNDEKLILQPTRVIERKGIEKAIELVHSLNLERPRLVISHPAGDEGRSYLERIQRIADELKVELVFIDSLLQDTWNENAGSRHFSLSDIYLNSDLVTYPSLYEGFGNALLEAVYFKRPLVVYPYPVYNADIKPRGFSFIEIGDQIDLAVIEQVKQILAAPQQWDEVAEENFTLAKKFYSLETLEQILQKIIY